MNIRVGDVLIGPRYGKRYKVVPSALDNQIILETEEGIRETWSKTSGSLEKLGYTVEAVRR